MSTQPSTYLFIGPVQIIMPLCKVKGKVVYHIHDGDWRVGETYHIGEKKNKFQNIDLNEKFGDLKMKSKKLCDFQIKNAIADWTHLNTSEIFYLRDVITKLNQLDDLSAKEDIIKCLEKHKHELIDIRNRLGKGEALEVNDVIWDYRRAVDVLRRYLLLVREYVFEDVRFNSFSALPSRQKCLWVIEDNGNVNESIEFWWNELDREWKLLKLEINGDLFQSDETHLRLELVPIESLNQRPKAIGEENLETIQHIMNTYLLEMQKCWMK